MFNPNDPNPTAFTVLPTGATLTGAAARSDGTLGYVLLPSSAEVGVLDNATPPALTTRVAVPPLPVLSAYRNTEEELLVANLGAGRTVTRITGITATVSTKTLPLDITIAATAHPDPAKRFFYLSNTSLDFSDPMNLLNQRNIVQYNPATDTFSNMGCNSFGFPCVVAPLALGVSAAQDKLFANGIDTTTFGPNLNWRSATNLGQSLTQFAIPNAAGFPSMLLAVSEARPHVYVPSTDTSGNFFVEVIDTSGSGNEITEVRLPGAATGFALVDPDNRLYVSEGSAGVVEVVDTSAAPPDVVNSYPTGGAPGALAWDPVTQQLAVVDDTNGNVIFIDTTSGTQHTLADLGNPAAGGAAGLISVSSLTHPFVVGTGAGRVLYADNRHGTVAAIDASAPAADMQISTLSVPRGSPGHPYSSDLATTGQLLDPVGYEIISGALPAGLNLAAGGTLSGTPTEAGTFSFMVRTGDSATPKTVDVEDLQITVVGPIIITRALPIAAPGQPYTYALQGTGGTTPYQWTSSDLATNCPWLSLDPNTGTLTGTPAGTSDSCCFAVTLTDTDNLTDLRNPLCVDVQPAPQVTSVDPPTGETGSTMDVRVLGTDFAAGPGLSVSWGRGGVPTTDVVTNTVTFVSSTELRVNITINPLAPLGAVDTTVTNPDGQSGTLLGTDPGHFSLVDTIAPPDLGNVLRAVKNLAGNTVDLSWTDPNPAADLAGYNPYSSLADPLTWTLLGTGTLPPTTLSYSDPMPASNTWYRVRTLDVHSNEGP
jgi:hypothetical protein